MERCFRDVPPRAGRQEACCLVGRSQRGSYRGWCVPLLRPPVHEADASTDVRNWSTNYNKTAGCTEKEITAFDAQLNPPPESGHKKLVDAWRHLHLNAVGYYTYFSYRFQCREKGIGWRLDSFVVRFFFAETAKGSLTLPLPSQLSERLLPKVKTCEIRLEVCSSLVLPLFERKLTGTSADGASDHVPVMLDIEGPL